MRREPRARAPTSGVTATDGWHRVGADRSVKISHDTGPRFSGWRSVCPLRPWEVVGILAELRQDRLGEGRNIVNWIAAATVMADASRVPFGSVVGLLRVPVPACPDPPFADELGGAGTRARGIVARGDVPFEARVTPSHRDVVRLVASRDAGTFVPAHAARRLLEPTESLRSMRVFVSGVPGGRDAFEES